MRKFVDDNYPGRILLAEACQMPNEVRKYFGDGDEFHLGFHFPVMPRIYMAIKREDGSCLRDIMEDTPTIPNNCQWVTFLRNHDELTLEMVTPDERKWMWEQYAPIPRMRINLGIRRRLASLMDNDARKIELAYSLLFTLPGSPIIYYGDEIGMGDNIWLEDRHGVRTPVQWTPEPPHGGFSPAEKIYSPVIKDDTFGYQKVNVESAVKDPGSLFHVIRTMLQRRRRHLAFGHGDFKWVNASSPTLTCFLRSYGIDRMLIVHNLSHAPVVNGAVYLPTSEFQGTSGGDGIKVFDILTELPVCLDNRGSLHLNLEPYQFLWLNLGEMRQLGDKTVKPVPARRMSIVPPPNEVVDLIENLKVKATLQTISEEAEEAEENVNISVKVTYSLKPSK